MRWRLVVGALAVLTVATTAAWLSATNVASPADPAVSTCQSQVASVIGKVGGEIKTVSGAFAVPAAKVADWQERRGPASGPRPVSQWRQVPATEILNVCYFDGLFYAPGGPLSSNPRPPYDRLIVVIDAKGTPVLDTATWQTVFPVVDPVRFVPVTTP
jgi:hypothetical protein